MVGFQTAGITLAMLFLGATVDLIMVPDALLPAGCAPRADADRDDVAHLRPDRRRQPDRLAPGARLDKEGIIRKT